VRLLLLRFRLLGDIILTTPAVQLLREAYPSAKLDYVVEPSFREAVEGLPGIDEVLVFDRARLKRHPSENLAFMLDARSRCYDAVIDFHGGPRSGVIARSTGAPVRIGYSGPQAFLFYNRRVRRSVPGTRFHSVVQQIRLLEPLGIAHAEELPGVRMPEPPASSWGMADGLLRGARAGGYEGLAVLHVPPPKPFRDWGAERAAEVAEGLVARGLQPVLVGGEDSVDAAECLRALSRERAVSVAGRTTLLDLRALIAVSRIFVGVDSGPMHVAATTSTPIVAIFGPNVPGISGPWSTRATIIEEADLSCRPCDQRGCAHGDFRCYGRIAARRILEAVDHWLRAPVERIPQKVPTRLYGDVTRN